MKAVAAPALLLIAVFSRRSRPATVAFVRDVEKSAAGLRLLKLDPNSLPVWISEEDKLELMRAHIRFFNVTETWEDKVALKAAEGESVGALRVVPRAVAAVPRVRAPGEPVHLALKGTLTRSQLTASTMAATARLRARRRPTLLLSIVNGIISGRGDIPALL